MRSNGSPVDDSSVSRKRVLEVRVGLACLWIEAGCSARPELASFLDRLLSQQCREEHNQCAISGNHSIVLETEPCRGVSASEL